MRGIRDGRYLLRPAHCPLERPGKAYCDFEQVCGYTPELRQQFQRPDGLPAVEPFIDESEEEEKRSKTEENKKKEEEKEEREGRPEYLHPDCTSVDDAAAQVREEHAEALNRAMDLNRDVVISAGAGTGKTYSLVLRYLESLVAGASPQQILCITFTRRAAAEMAHRIRQALLNPAQGRQQELADALRTLLS